MLSFREQLTPMDIDNIRTIANSTGFFGEDISEISVNIAETTLNGYTKNTYKFLFAENDGKMVAYACFGKILDSDATYELYWLSTLNEYRGKGIGKKIISKLIETVRNLGGSKIFVKTDGTKQYAPTRSFYEKCGFKNEAILKEYYDESDDCYIYSYKL